MLIIQSAIERLRSTVVVRVTSNDEVVCSIQAKGMFFWPCRRRCGVGIALFMVEWRDHTFCNILLYVGSAKDPTPRQRLRMTLYHCRMRETDVLVLVCTLVRCIDRMLSRIT